MAAGSLLALLDDIASILDDVSVLTKTAASKTAGVLGDDLALNAQQVSGVVAKRELPVVWGVAKGSFVNKLILVPLALLISAFAPWAVTPLLMVGGLYLCFEGCEKLVHKFFHPKKKTVEEARQELATLEVNPETEKEKIKGAIRTDFVLSAEIIAITLGTVAESDFLTRVRVLSTIAVVMTIGVYGLVACIVKLDDLGLFLSQRRTKFSQAFGRGILAMAPLLMKFLTIAGTAAMFLVGGGILTHGIPPVHHEIEHIAAFAGEGVPAAIVGALLNGIFGVLAGAVVLLVISGIKKLRGKPAH
jgi:predicted DNA repair protein MutK